MTARFCLDCGRSRGKVGQQQLVGYASSVPVDARRRAALASVSVRPWGVVRPHDGLARLNEIETRGFDEAYLDREVVCLQHLVNTVDTFIRATTSVELKMLLIRFARPSSFISTKLND